MLSIQFIDNAEYNIIRSILYVKVVRMRSMYKAYSFLGFQLKHRLGQVTLLLAAFIEGPRPS